MKLQELFEKVNNIENVINRKDLIAILDVFDVSHTGSGSTNCFIKATAEAISLLTKKRFTGPALSKAVERANSDFDSSKVHPNHLTGKKLTTKSYTGERFEIQLSHEMVDSIADIKKWIAKKVPVILSVRWNKAYYYPASFLRDGAKPNSSKLDQYRDDGATFDMIEKAKNGIIPYPSPEFLEKWTGENDDTTHAILCVGYDAKDKCFICRDFLNGGEAAYRGFLKIDEKCFFDSKLKQLGASMVDAAIAIEVEEVENKEDKFPEEILPKLKKALKGIVKTIKLQHHDHVYAVANKEKYGHRFDLEDAVQEVVDEDEFKKFLNQYGRNVSISVSTNHDDNKVWDIDLTFFEN